MAKEVRLSQWSEVMRARRESGETVRSFCQTNGIDEKKYYYWQRRLRETACEVMSERRDQMMSLAPAPAFAEIPLSSNETSQESMVVVRIGRYSVEIQSGADEGTVERVLRAVSHL